MVSKRGKIWIGVSLLFLIIIVIVIVTLFLTIFKMRDPVISIHPVGFENIKFSLNISFNTTIGMLINMRNPNYGAFKYRNSTSHVSFRDIVVADVPIRSEVVPARGDINVNTTADFMVGKLIVDPNFWTDISAGTLNLTSKATLPGVARILKIIKLKATAYSTCNITMQLFTKNITSQCKSKIKLN